MVLFLIVLVCVHCMVSVTLGGIRKTVKMEQVLRDGDVYRELTAKLPEIAH